MVYLVNLESTSWYKIGKAKDVKKRVKQLQTGASFPLIIVAEFETQDQDSTLEKVLHRRFSAYQTQGEWFDFDSVGIDWVKEQITQLQEIIKNI